MFQPFVRNLQGPQITRPRQFSFPDSQRTRFILRQPGSSFQLRRSGQNIGQMNRPVTLSESVSRPTRTRFRIIRRRPDQTDSTLGNSAVNRGRMLDRTAHVQETGSHMTPQPVIFARNMQVIDPNVQQQNALDGNLSYS